MHLRTLAPMKIAPAAATLRAAARLCVQDKDKVRQKQLAAGEDGATAQAALGSVVGVLLQHPELELRAHGAALLQQFTAMQVRMVPFLREDPAPRQTRILHA